MKKGITIGAIIVAIGGALVLWIGGFLSKGEDIPTQPKFDVPQEAVYGSASDPEQGLYKVTYWLVQKDVFSYALLPQEATFFWKDKPSLIAVEAVVRLPVHITKRKYTFCGDCPVTVQTLREPQRKEEMKDEENSK
jgi:hypothetical protein